MIFIPSSLALTGLIATALAINPSVLSSISKRDSSFCPEWKNTQPRVWGPEKLLDEYHPGGLIDGPTNDCPHKHSVDSDGACRADLDPNNSRCSAYCEDETYWFFGPELPITGSSCTGLECTLTTTDTVSVSTKWEVNFGVDLGIKGGPGDSVDAALKLGASWSSTRTEGRSKGESFSPPSDAACGYWTYIPVNVGSCGSLSIFETKESRTSGGWTGTWSSTYHCAKEATTTQHVCTNRALINDNGEAAGATVFVKQDCDSHRTLCKKHQAWEFRQQTNPDTKWSMKYSGDVENCVDDANAWTIGAQKPPTQTTANPAVIPAATLANSPTPAPVGGGDCTWKGHCIGAPCKDYNDCSDSFVCTNGVCTA